MACSHVDKASFRTPFSRDTSRSSEDPSLGTPWGPPRGPSIADPFESFFVLREICFLSCNLRLSLACNFLNWTTSNLSKYKIRFTVSDWIIRATRVNWRFYIKIIFWRIDPCKERPHPHRKFVETLIIINKLKLIERLIEIWIRNKTIKINWNSNK